MSDLKNAMRRIDQLELIVRRITQIDTKPRLIIPDSIDFVIIEYTIDSIAEKSTGPYVTLIAATVTIRGVLCGRGAALIGTQVEVIDHSGCIFDEADMTDYTGWAVSNMEYLSLDPGAATDEMTPCHYAAINRCCAPGSGTYA